MNQRNPSFLPVHRVGAVLAVTALALGLSACSKPAEPTVGQRLDSAIEKTEEVAAKAQAQTETLLEKAQSGAEKGAAQAEAAVKNAGEAASEKAAEAMAVVDDASITVQVTAGLAKDPELSPLRIDVDTREGTVTLKGKASTSAARERAESIAQAIKGVRRVSNQLTVSAG